MGKGFPPALLLLLLFCLKQWRPLFSSLAGSLGLLIDQKVSHWHKPHTAQLLNTKRKVN